VRRSLSAATPTEPTCGWLPDAATRSIQDAVNPPSATATQTFQSRLVSVKMMKGSTSKPGTPRRSSFLIAGEE